MCAVCVSECVCVLIILLCVSVQFCVVTCVAGCMCSSCVKSQLWSHSFDSSYRWSLITLSGKKQMECTCKHHVHALSCELYVWRQWFSAPVLSENSGYTHSAHKINITYIATHSHVPSLFQFLSENSGYTQSVHKYNIHSQTQQCPQLVPVFNIFLYVILKTWTRL